MKGGSQMTRIRTVLGASLLLFATGGLAQSTATTPAWTLSGTNEILVENYDVSGDPSNSLYRYEGTFVTDRLNLNLNYATSPYRALSIRTELLGTDSDYLRDDGLVVANLTLDYMNGLATVPYRVGAGDVFVDLSRRALQRQIRGASFEIQPDFGHGTHSILLVSGSGIPAWRDTFDRGTDLYFNGLSYLWASESGHSRIVANLVDETQKAGTFGAVPVPTVDRDQLVTSLYGETRIGGVALEAEISLLDSGERGDSDSTSVYAQIAHNEGKLSWRARYEQNDATFIPIGGLGIISDYRIAEAHARYATGLRSSLRARVQHYENAFDSEATERRTDVVGLSWETRPLPKRPNLRIDLMGDVNRINSDDDSFDQTFYNARARVADRLTPRVDFSWELQIRDSNAEGNPLYERTLVENELMLGRRFQVAFAGRPLQGQIRGGVDYRRQSENGTYEAWSPVIDADIHAGRQSLRLHLGWMDQRFLSAIVDDLRYQTRRLSWSFTPGAHAISLELAQEVRDREHQRGTDSNRIALRYRYSFDRTF